MSKTLSAEAEHKPYFTTKRMALIGVMTAVTCILGPFSIPLPFSPVPISFTNLAIYLAAYVLGMKACTISYLIYMLLGMVGVPVFSGFTAGVGKLAGPTGGYLVGFILMALIVGFLCYILPNIYDTKKGTAWQALFRDFLCKFSRFFRAFCPFLLHSFTDCQIMKLPASVRPPAALIRTSLPLFSVL